MKLVGEVRSIERACGNSSGAKDAPEKRNFKINIRPASKPDAYYGYGHMQFILHGRELDECGLDLGTKVAMYLVPDGAEPPPHAEADDVRRLLYEAEQSLVAAQAKAQADKERYGAIERERFSAGEERRALQAENVRLTVELMTLRGATANFAPAPQMIDNTVRSTADTPLNQVGGSNE